MSYVFANNALATLTVDALAGATTLTVAAVIGANPPVNVTSGLGIVSLMDKTFMPTAFEIVTYTGRTDNGNGTYTLTGVSRGQEGTTAQSWTAGTYAVQAFTSAAHQDLLTALSGKSDTGHAHAQSDVTGLTTALSGKSDTSHTHSGVYQPADADLDTWATKTAPSGTVVGTSDTQTLSAKTLTGLKETKVAVAASAIDLSTGNLFTKTISGATTFTVSNTPSTGTAASFILELTNGGSATVTWWSGMKWASGTAPTLTAAGVDCLGFYTHDGGTTWRGFVLGLDSK